MPRGQWSRLKCVLLAAGVRRVRRRTIVRGFPKRKSDCQRSASSESARGLAQSKTLRGRQCHRGWRQLLDCASPLALSDPPWPCQAKQISSRGEREYHTLERFSLEGPRRGTGADRKSTRLNSSHLVISYAVFCLKKKK